MTESTRQPPQGTAAQQALHSQQELASALQQVGWSIPQLLNLLNRLGPALDTAMKLFEQLVDAFTERGFRAIPPEAKTPNPMMAGCCDSVKEHLIQALAEILKCEECCQPQAGGGVGTPPNATGK